MGSKKKKYNARFPPARIKKIMQTDEEVGKMAAAVPVVISRALELFLESMVTKTVQVANEGNAKTLTSSHVKAVVEAESSFDFLKNLVVNIPELSKTCIRQESMELKPAEGQNFKRKKVAPSATVTSSAATSATGDNANPPKRRRGRPPKVKVTKELSGVEESSSAAAFTPYASKNPASYSKQPTMVSLLHNNGTAVHNPREAEEIVASPMDLTIKHRSAGRTSSQAMDTQSATSTEVDYNT